MLNYRNIAKEEFVTRIPTGQSFMDEIVNLVDSCGRAKRLGFDFDVSDMLRAISSANIQCSERQIYRIIEGLNIEKERSGWYSRADLAVIVGWLKNQDKYKSFAEYGKFQGRLIYQKAAEKWGAS